jgi:hypothetical protein
MSLPDGFLELPGEIYAGDPHWIPEDPALLSHMFGAGSPWQGEMRAFCVPGRARVAVFRSPAQEVDGVPSAFFGYFENTGDDQAVATVLEAARRWGAAAGARRLYGPINFTTAMPYRVRISGPADAYLDEPYNPLRYAGQLEAGGFELTRSYASHDFDPGDIAALADNTVAQRAEAAKAGFRLEPLTPELWAARADEMFSVGNDVFAGNFAFEPLTREQFAIHFGDQWARRLHPELSLVCLDPSDRVAGVGFVYPHYAPLAALGAGERRVPLRELNFADHGGENTEIVFKTAGVASTHRRLGLGWAISGETAQRAREAGITKLYMGPMREDNPSLNAVRHGWRQQRVYGLFATDL